jgi:hypothetical protein
MRRFIWATSYLAGGIAAGCLSALVVIQSAGVEPLADDPPWISRTESLAGRQSFLVRAHYMMEGRLPPAPGQLTEATAETDADGRPLTSNCMYRLSAAGPLPAWWSLSVTGGTDPQATLQATADSASVLRGGDGQVSITAATAPQPGNWLRVPPGNRRFTLLYWALAEGDDDAAPPFAITREGCP